MRTMLTLSLAMIVHRLEPECGLVSANRSDGKAQQDPNSSAGKELPRKRVWRRIRLSWPSLRCVAGAYWACAPFRAR